MRSVPGREVARQFGAPGTAVGAVGPRLRDAVGAAAGGVAPGAVGTPPALGAAGGGAPGRPAAWSVRLSGRPHSEASSVRRDAAAPSCFRRVAGRRSAALLEPAWWQVPAAA